MCRILQLSSFRNVSSLFANRMLVCHGSVAITSQNRCSYRQEVYYLDVVSSKYHRWSANDTCIWILFYIGPSCFYIIRDIARVAYISMHNESGTLAYCIRLTFHHISLTCRQQSISTLTFAIGKKHLLQVSLTATRMMKD